MRTGAMLGVVAGMVVAAVAAAPGASASNSAATAGPALDGTVQVSADFNDLPQGAVDPAAFNAEVGATNKNAAAYDDITVVPDDRGTGNVLRTVLKAGTVHSQPGNGDNGDNLFVELPAHWDSACITYDVRFDATFDFSLGGKLPGLEGVAPGISPNAPTGGHPTENGWSGRMMWVGPDAYKWAGPSNMAISYMYHPGQKNEYGDNIRWGKAFEPGVWHQVKQCYVMNTPGQANGTLAALWDGQFMVYDTNFVFRTKDDVHISHLAFSIYRGGHTMDWAGDRDGYVDIDNLVIST